MIHMKMAHQQIDFGDTFARQGKAKLADACSGVEHDNVGAAPDLHAGRIAAVKERRLAWRSDRAPGSPEFNREGRSNPPQWCSRPFTLEFTTGLKEPLHAVAARIGSCPIN